MSPACVLLFPTTILCVVCLKFRLGFQCQRIYRSSASRQITSTLSTLFVARIHVHPLKQTRLLICCCCYCCFCWIFLPLLIFPHHRLYSVATKSASHVLSFSGVVSTASQLAHLLAAAHVAPHVLGAEIEEHLEARLSVNWSTESR